MLVLVEGDIGTQETAANTVNAAMERFGGIDVLVNNAEIYYTKPFTDFTTEDFHALASAQSSGDIFGPSAILACSSQIFSYFTVSRERYASLPCPSALVLPRDVIGVC
jgi:NAD(P)-dependent dehydrogenase (short-subunit alcohol dehydrogenase family)